MALSRVRLARTLSFSVAMSHTRHARCSPRPCTRMHHRCMASIAALRVAALLSARMSDICCSLSLMLCPSCRFSTSTRRLACFNSMSCGMDELSGVSHTNPSP